MTEQQLPHNECYQHEPCWQLRAQAPPLKQTGLVSGNTGTKAAAAAPWEMPESLEEQRACLSWRNWLENMPGSFCHSSSGLLTSTWLSVQVSHLLAEKSKAAAHSLIFIFSPSSLETFPELYFSTLTYICGGDSSFHGSPRLEARQPASPHTSLNVHTGHQGCSARHHRTLAANYFNTLGTSGI